MWNTKCRHKLVEMLRRPDVIRRESLSFLLGTTRVENSLSRHHRLTCSVRRKTVSMHSTRHFATKTKALTMTDATKEMAILYKQSIQLEPLPPVWVTDESLAQESQRQELFEGALKLVRKLKFSIKYGAINPLGKHGRDVSLWMGQAMHILSQTANPNALAHAAKLMAWLKGHNLHISPQHYSSIIEIACREERWDEACQLFHAQIDPELSSPLDVSLMNPVGLYAVARQSETNPAENVMDAVISMCMISPTDQDKYVLAAGVALGHAGEWSSCLNYLKNSENSTRLGQPLVAATMYACLLCREDSQALALFDEYALDDEWQWSGGGSLASEALLNDLAMRALGGVSSHTERAFELYQKQAQDENPISLEALWGVVLTCEETENWEGAVEVLYSLLHNWRNREWLASGQESLSEAALQMNNSNVRNAAVRYILSSVMRTCNSCGRFGLALYLFELTNHLLLNADTTSLEDSMYHGNGGEQANEENLVVSMVSLCGVGCHDEAARLYEAVSNRREDAREWTAAQEGYEYAKSVTHNRATVAWSSAHRHICRLLAAISKFDTEHTEKQHKALVAGLAKAMHCCTAASHPDVAIHLAERINAAIDTSSVRSVFDLAQWTGSKAKVDIRYSNDHILAETMRAMSTMGWTSDRLVKMKTRDDILHCVLRDDPKSHVENKKRSKNVAIGILFHEGQANDAMRLYNEMDADDIWPSTLSTVAAHFLSSKQSKKVEDLYMNALSRSCLSEELALLAMNSIVQSNLDGKGRLRVLRSMVDDVARMTGLSAKSWLHERYWLLKDAVGEHHARLLMYWQPDERGQKKEMELAISQFVEERNRGLVPRNDVLMCIVNCIRFFNEGTETGDLPQDLIGNWKDLLLQVVAESGYSSMSSNSEFANEVALAFRALGMKREHEKFVQDALERGVPIQDVAIEET